MKQKILLIPILAVFIVSLVLLANAAVNYGDAWHPVQQVAIDDSGSSDSIDEDEDGLIDASENMRCTGSNSCVVESTGQNLEIQTRTFIETGSNPSSGSPIFLVESSGGSERLRVEHNGETSTTNDLRVHGDAYADSFIYTSDKRLKQDITSIDNALEKLQNIDGVNFKWKESGEESIGLVAQNVETEFPELVKTNDEGMKSVEYAQMVGVLTEAVKEQQKEIDELKNEVEKLKQD